MALYTIIAISGDNGMTNAIGRFTTLPSAQQQASRWQHEENPGREMDGMHYSAARVKTIREWKETP